MPPAPTADVPMRDANEPASSPAPPPHTAPSPAPGARYGTPNRGLNSGDGGPSSSRAGSVHPEASNLNLPSHPISHGDTARMYINNNVTSVLLEGMKMIGKDQPDSPLKVLGEFLLQKSREKGEPGSVN
ncbi:Set1 complex component sdc1 [Colletotrichum sidae]|uniref:Set1 complex component sdc1 n=1 Tax=Colletotrichum sidae TaxID=1347389 RepID=A0A4R8TK36_9PEZI|nr:Set1 complex component sdc1 [Colletotrichum sidae]